MDLETQTAEAIIARHYDKAWRLELSYRWQAETGRRTKAKERDHELARARADALREVIADIRDNGGIVDTGGN